MERRPATPQEAKALGHPLRMRILRLCLDEPRTNKQLAERLGKDPGSVLFHVRRLAATGFLEVGDPVKGPTGAWEKPYRSTGKSWRLSLEDYTPSHAVSLLEVIREELMESGPQGVRETIRVGLRLSPGDTKELNERMSALADEFAERVDPEGERLGLFMLLHERPD